jgi:hypothetical protein
VRAREDNWNEERIYNRLRLLPADTAWISLRLTHQAQHLPTHEYLQQMAPSIAENPTAEVVVPVKANPQASASKPKVRRIIDEEGGKSTASVRNAPTTI